MHLAEKLSIAIRHNKHLEHTTWLWNAVRPLYNSVVSFTGRRGLKRIVNGTDSILVSPLCRGVIEEYEPDVWRALMTEIRSGDSVADIGTFLGLYTVALGKRVGPAGRVFAFEPDPRSFAFLKENIRLNCLGERVVLFRAAVGSSDGEVCLASEASQSHIVPDEKSGASDDRAYHVKCVMLDSVFADRRLDVVKIDVEGYEEMVLQGATNLLSDQDRRPRAIFIEVHPYAWHALGTTSDSLLQLLRKHGYTVFYVDGVAVERVERYGEIVARS